MSVRADGSTTEPHHGDFGRLMVLALAALACMLVGVWGVVKLAGEDWFIGVVFLVCAVIGLARVLGRVIASARSG
jgi:hypothetical protein